MTRDWVNEVREAMQVPKMPSVFVLGSFERRVTLYSQQVRALNLVEALLSLGRLGPGRHVAVIGAGVAGLTFAAAAARKGVEVTVLEKEDCHLSLFRHDPRRWLHPRVYDWPMPNWHHGRAGLPVLDWESGTVEQVRRQLEDGWKTSLANAKASIHEVYHSREINLEPQEHGVWVSWSEAAHSQRPVSNGKHFALAVLAVGFGIEKADQPGYRTYWEPDDFDSYGGFIPGKDERRTWLVSGCGDGALTDLLRLCIRDFKHEDMVKDFVDDQRIASFIEQIRTIENDPRARDPHQPKFLQEAYQELKAPFVVELLQSRLRLDTQVKLNATTSFYFQRDSSVLNRFLVAQLRHAGGFEFVRGKIVSVREEGRKARVAFKERAPEIVDRVVLRHGPMSAVQKYFPEIWKACRVQRESWKQAPHLLDQTRQRYWGKGAFGPEERPEDSLQPAPRSKDEHPSVSTLASTLRHTWKPLFAHALEPAKHFQGRQALVTELGVWLDDPDSPVRVFALCAAGGTGKTALVEYVLTAWRRKHERSGNPLPGGLLVWSFYESERIEDFLATACSYFLGEAGQVGGRFERLIAELQRGDPHLVVLDGFETVQSSGAVGRAQGEIEDRQLKRLISLVASGFLGRTRLLVTSRFVLSELRDLADPERYKEERLEDLDPSAARGLLRAWKVNGDDSTLDKLTDRVGRHALSVRVLGAYLAQVGNGDPTVGLTLDLGDALNEASEGDAKAAKLARLITHYAKAMKPDERELMTRLSLFPRGVAVDILVTLIGAGGQVAGRLVGSNQPRLLGLLERLVEQGLAFGYGALSRRIYTAHPFLRDTFRALAGVPVEEMHEVVRSKLAPTLSAQPGKPPRTPEMLDRYETLIEYTRLAGKAEEACKLYWEGMGSYKNLGDRLGENARGVRLLSGFASDGDPIHCLEILPARWRSLIVNDWGLFAQSLGDLPLAGRCLAVAININRQQNTAKNLSIVLQNATELEQLRGHLPQSVAYARESLDWARQAKVSSEIEDSHAYLAWSLALAGEVKSAVTHFATAARLEGELLYSIRGIMEAEFRRLRGDLVGSRERCLNNLQICEDNGWARHVARIHTLLGRLVLHEDPNEARRHLGFARGWTQRSGDMEVLLRAHLLASEIALAMKDPRESLDEAEGGRVQADALGFGLYAIDLRLAAARAHLMRGDYNDALRYAQQALDRAMHPNCGYAWGQADAEHLIGLALRNLNERELARARFLAAESIRKRIRHPGAAESQRAAKLAGG